MAALGNPSFSAPHPFSLCFRKFSGFIRSFLLSFALFASFVLCANHMEGEKFEVTPLTKVLIRGLNPRLQ
jgi:hypothetical protein